MTRPIGVAQDLDRGQMTPIGLDDFLDTALAAQPAVLSDLDGCLVAEGSALPHAARLVREIGDRLFVVSNNSADTAVTLSRALATLGLPIKPQRMLLAGEATVRLLAERLPDARVALFASPALRDLAESLGLREDAFAPDAALLARAPGFSLDDLTTLARLVDRGVPLWLTNNDRFHPAADGTPVPETGALFAAVEAVTSVGSLCTIGKPSPYLVTEALVRAGVAATDAVLIGDTPETDGEAAAAAGVAYIRTRRPVPAKARAAEPAAAEGAR